MGGPATLGPGFDDITPPDLRTGVFPRPASRHGRFVVTGAVFADLDEDGRSEVVLVHRDVTPGGPGVPLVRRYTGAALEAAASALPVEIFPAAVIDLDGDGHVDIVGMRPDPTQPRDDLRFVSGRVVLRFGLGGGRLPKRRVTSATRAWPTRRFSSSPWRSLTSTLTGWLDFAVANNSCCTRCPGHPARAPRGAARLR
ncbi:MAG: hypothetical protein V9G12_19550 [Microthrixaceae bacterium]